MSRATHRDRGSEARHPDPVLWVVRLDDRGWGVQHPIEPVEEQGMHDGEMTSVFVCRPFAGVRASLQKRSGTSRISGTTMPGACSRALMMLGISDFSVVLQTVRDSVGLTLYETPVPTPVARCPITRELAPAAFRVRRILPDSLTAIKPFPDINCRNSL